MDEWLLWMVLAAALVGLEMFIGTFYLLMIGLGMAAGGIAAIAGATTSVQLLVAAITGIASTYVLRRMRASRARIEGRFDAARDRNINLDIGQPVDVEQWQHHSNGIYRARITYRGAQWDAELEPGSKPEAGRFIIREVRGSQLIVANGDA